MNGKPCRRRMAWRELVLRLSACAGLIAAFAVTGCSSTATARGSAPEEAFLIVAVEDPPDLLPTVGGTPRARYAPGTAYRSGRQGEDLTDQVASEYRLEEHAFWHIGPLGWRCGLFRIPAGSDRDALIARLARDPRVALAQPLNGFDTFAVPPAAAASAEYDDPYLKLQRGFATINAGAAHRWTTGAGVTVAVIDTGVDGSHADLRGRMADERDFGGAAHPPTAGGERHGTEVAGVIAASANNRIGIVGIAPGARVRAYRACWPVGAQAAHCDSFSLAQALAAAIADSSDIINLSLGGPADPLLQKLAESAMRRGAVIVGAMPPVGLRSGFPAGVPGVLAVSSSDDKTAPGGHLAAPGSEILTLVPGGSFDYASGSSLAAAHVTGAIALLRALQPGLSGQAALAVLTPGAADRGRAIDVCAALRRLVADAGCGRDGR